MVWSVLCQPPSCASGCPSMLKTLGLWFSQTLNIVSDLGLALFSFTRSHWDRWPWPAVAVDLKEKSLQWRHHYFVSSYVIKFELCMIVQDLHKITLPLHSSALPWYIFSGADQHFVSRLERCWKCKQSCTSLVSFYMHSYVVLLIQTWRTCT